MNIFTNYFAATVSLRHLEERILQWLRRRRPLLGIVNHEILREQETITQCRILKKTKLWRSSTNNSRPAWERVHLGKRSEWVGSAALERIEESGTAFEPLACFIFLFFTYKPWNATWPFQEGVCMHNTVTFVNVSTYFIPSGQVLIVGEPMIEQILYISSASEEPGNNGRSVYSSANIPPAQRRFKVRLTRDYNLWVFKSIFHQQPIDLWESYN